MIEMINQETQERFKKMILERKVRAIVRGRSNSGQLYYSVFGFDGGLSWDFTPALAYMSGAKKYDKSPLPYWEIRTDIFDLIYAYVLNGEYSYWQIRDMIPII